VVGYVLFAYTHSFLMLLISRVVSGLGGSSIGVAQAYISDVTMPEERSKGMGLIGVAFGLGFVFGPIIGGILSQYSYQITGFASAGFSLLALLFSFFYLPESRKVNEGAPLANVHRRKLIDIQAFRKVFSNKSLSIVILMFFIITFSVANIYGTFALMGTAHYHFTNKQNGYIFGIIGIVSAVIQGGLIGRLTKRFTDVQIISMGAVVMMIGLAMLPYGRNFVGVACITAILSMGTGSLSPILLSLVSKVAPDNEQGLTLGVNQSLSAFARMLGPLWGGYAFQYLGYQIPFLTGAVLTFFIFVFSSVFLSKHIAH
jgi:DHA1 family tetracycline resistance protein-like MFS transporter